MLLNRVAWLLQRIRIHRACWVLGFAIYSHECRAGNASSLIDISSDSRLLVCTNRDSGTVTVVDLMTHRKQAEIAVGKLPEGVSFLGQSHVIAVAVYADDKVVFVDADRGERTGEVTVFDEPYGVVSNREGTRVFATLDYPGAVVEIDPREPRIVREFQVGEFLRGVAISPDERRLLVTENYSGNVIALDVETGQAIDSWAGISNDNLCRQVVIHPLRPKAYAAHIRSRVTAVHGEGSIFPYVSVMDLSMPTEEATISRRRRRIPMDSFRGALVTANPWDCTISADGRQFYVVFAGTDDLFVCDVLDDDYREIAYREHIVVGRNPRAVRTTPDSSRFYVYNALDFNVVGYDARSLKEVARIEVTQYPGEPQMLRGKVLFYSAQQPMASRRWISCSSCHPDGDPDGRTWHNPEGLRNTQSLAGMAWTHPIHWSADRDEVQDFEYTIRGKLMQGRGLLAGELQAELALPNAGRSDELDALALYSNSHEFRLSPHARDGLSTTASRGREIFLSQQTRCSECHSGPFYTDSQPRPELLRHNVGTGSDPAEKLAPEYDTPSLLGVYRTAPYLHHGKAATLLDVLTTENVGDQHGVTSHLDAGQLNDLIEFLKALPYEDPEAGASAANMTKVKR